MKLPEGFGDKIIALETIINYSFKDKSTAWEALQLAGNGFNTKFITNGNKRLAVVGDLVIDIVLSEAWYRSGKAEAAWTAIRGTVSSNANLATLGWDLDLDHCIQRSLTNRQGISDKMMATTVESIVGAVFLDSGKDLSVVEAVMTTMKILTAN